MAVRVGLITTLNTNIGDDFIREGLKKVIRSALHPREVTFVAVNKHEPHSVYPRWHPIGAAAVLPRGRSRVERLARRTLHRFGFTRFDGCDLIVQCGAPVLWPGCHRAEWAEPLWKEVVGRISDRTPVLNLAAGSCFPWGQRDDADLEPLDREFAQRIVAYCRLTTARDRLAARLFSLAGGEVSLLCCSALLAADEPGRRTDAKGLVLVNYMSGAGHYDWGEGVDARAWESTMQALVQRLKQRFRVAFLCHDRHELGLAARIDASLPRWLPTSPGEYFQAVSGATAAVCNRLHASVGLAGCGIPSVAVGNDTRMLMADACGIPTYFAKGVDGAAIEATLEDLIDRQSAERDRLLSLREETWNAYTSAVASALR